IPVCTAARTRFEEIGCSCVIASEAIERTVGRGAGCFVPEALLPAKGPDQLLYISVALGDGQGGNALQAILPAEDIQLGHNRGKGGLTVGQPADISQGGGIAGADV